MALYTPYNAKSSSSTPQLRTTEFEVLKASHQFLRKDEDVDESQLSWDDRLAKKYYSSLYREFAVCDLKHYKSGNFALRWRTEEEVLSGAGETTCGNSRCPLHQELSDIEENARPALATLELPFSYVEQGENKSALVKVVLCSKCCKKLMWKRNKEKLEAEQQQHVEGKDDVADGVNAAGAVETKKRRRSHSSPVRDEGKNDRSGEHNQVAPVGQDDHDEHRERRRRPLRRSPRL